MRHAVIAVRWVGDAIQSASGVSLLVQFYLDAEGVATGAIARRTYDEAIEALERADRLAGEGRLWVVLNEAGETTEVVGLYD